MFVGASNLRPQVMVIVTVLAFCPEAANRPEQGSCCGVYRFMPAKKRTGFRFRKSVLDELKAMAEGPPRSPIRCTGSRRAVKRTRPEYGARPCASPSPQPRSGPGQPKRH
jgi:hypothetical protein